MLGIRGQSAHIHNTAAADLNRRISLLIGLLCGHVPVKECIQTREGVLVSHLFCAGHSLEGLVIELYRAAGRLGHRACLRLGHGCRRHTRAGGRLRCRSCRYRSRGNGCCRSRCSGCRCCRRSRRRYRSRRRGCSRYSASRRGSTGLRCSRHRCTAGSLGAGTLRAVTKQGVLLHCTTRCHRRGRCRCLFDLLCAGHHQQNCHNAKHSSHKVCLFHTFISLGASFRSSAVPPRAQASSPVHTQGSWQASHPNIPANSGNTQDLSFRAWSASGC